VKISYTIENEKIKVRHIDADKEPQQLVKVYNNSLPDISFLHIKGNISSKTFSIFDAAPERGIIISIQIIRQNSRFEFESYNNISINFAPAVESLQLMVTDVSFRYAYENPGMINRLDIYIPKEKISTFISPGILNRLRKQRVLNLNSGSGAFSSAMNDTLTGLIKELEKPSGSVSKLFEKFIRSVTL
jgi:hypothetical protein